MRIIKGHAQQAPPPPKPHVLAPFEPETDDEFLARWCQPLYWHLVYLAEHGQAMPKMPVLAKAMGWRPSAARVAFNLICKADLVRVVARTGATRDTVLWIEITETGKRTKPEGMMIWPVPQPDRRRDAEMLRRPRV